MLSFNLWNKDELNFFLSFSYIQYVLIFFWMMLEQQLYKIHCWTIFSFKNKKKKEDKFQMIIKQNFKETIPMFSGAAWWKGHISTYMMTIFINIYTAKSLPTTKLFHYYFHITRIIVIIIKSVHCSLHLHVLLHLHS